MALGDIKDAGILAGFVRWGWPFHGIIKGGTVGTTGQAHTQPLDALSNGANWGWLIEYGMPPVTLTPDEATYYAGLNMEWRNYALIAGGYAYNTYIGDETYIHIDEAGDAWRVALAYSFFATNTLRLTITLQRFGWLRVDGEYTAPAPLVKTVDVTCTYIELSDPFASGEPNYVSRSAKLQDVHTNGAKAMIGVLLRKNPGYGFDYVDDLYACVELTFTGAGGDSGVSLYPAAVEIIPYTSLRERDSSGGYAIDTWARYAFYAPDGTAKAVRMKFDAKYSSSQQRMIFSLLENSTVIDQFGWDASNAGSGWVLNATYGSLAAYVPAIDAVNGIIPASGIGNMIYPWRSIWDNRYEIAITFTYPASATNVFFYGLHRLPSKASAFVASNDNVTAHYGTVSTPAGSKTTTLTATMSTSSVNFAYQRKTLDYAFDSTPICYV